jgi:23S rRNA pseudouridine1911/1915/1917 synthase
MIEGKKSKIKIIIENGRTHQIRVHLQYAGMPIIGDLQYGKASNQVSRVMLLAKNEDFRKKAINEFKNHKVYKEYVAIVDGKIVEEEVIDMPISTIKGKTARSRIDEEHGKPAKTTVYPNMLEGKKSKIKIIIENGRTHQIRVHLQYAGMPIIGDLQYGKASNQVSRVMLHSKVTRILGYEFQAKEPKEFFHFGF